jgi:hypothetical protein
MMTTTMRSSMSEKPLRLLVFMVRDSGGGGEGWCVELDVSVDSYRLLASDT